VYAFGPQGPSQFAKAFDRARLGSRLCDHLAPQLHTEIEQHGLFGTANGLQEEHPDKITDTAFGLR
jgi:hypothetical protein